MAVIHAEAMKSQEKKAKKSTQQISSDDKKTLLVVQELKISRLLAGNEKVSRDRALKTLKKWIKRRAENLAFTEEDFMRLWKGLFYSMWMSDKPLIQEECADNIASLLHEFSFENSLIFFKCGLLTLCKEWFGIDQLRLDKFLMFVRRLLRQALVVLKKNGFLKESIIEFGSILSATVLDSERKDILGLFMHFTEIFLEELAKVSEGNLKPHLVAEFLLPFMKSMAVSDDPRRIKQIRKCIFIHLMFQSDVGLEYQERYDAWKRQGFPGTIHGMQKIEVDEGSDDEVISSESRILDPRAGRVDVVLPQIKFNPKFVADLLIKNKYTDNSKVAARKAMTLISKQLRKLAKGIYPLGVVDLRLPKDHIQDMNVRKAVNRLVKFDKSLKGDKRKRKNEEEPVRKKRKLESEPEMSSLELPKKYSKKGITVNGDHSDKKEVLPDYLLENGKMPELVFEKFSGIWKVYDDAPEQPDKFLDSVAKSLKKSSSITNKKKKDRVMQKGIQKKKKLSENMKKQIKDLVLGTGKVANLKKPEIFAKNPWDEPLKEGEYELTIPSRSYVEKLKKISKKSTMNVQQLIDNSLVRFKDPSELTKKAHCSTPERTKKVKIDTSLNQSQEFDEYHSQILSSPMIVFDASKKPGKPLLKSRGSSPINPFYKKYKR